MSVLQLYSRLPVVLASLQFEVKETKQGVRKLIHFRELTPYICLVKLVWHARIESHPPRLMEDF